MSMKAALEQLGLGPCHHMVEVFAHPESMQMWIEAGAGRPQWDAIFADYRAAVDYPSAVYWRELAAYYPHAKVLHTVRDPDEWFESTQATIFAPDGMAAKAIARQLKVRNIGGIIIIDFIDMAEEEHRRQVLQTLTDRLAGGTDHLTPAEIDRRANLAALADDLCIVRSMYTFNPTHTPARSLFHSGNIAAKRDYPDERRDLSRIAF